MLSEEQRLLCVKKIIEDAVRTILYCVICTVSHLLFCIILYCTVLSCAVLYCTVLSCTVLYCTVLCHMYCFSFTVLYYTVLYCTVLYCPVLYCTVLYCVTRTLLFLILLHSCIHSYIQTYIHTYCFLMSFLYYFVLYCFILWNSMLCHVFYIAFMFVMCYNLFYVILRCVIFSYIISILYIDCHPYQHIPFFLPIF